MNLSVDTKRATWQLPLRPERSLKIMEDYARLCMNPRTDNALNSAEECELVCSFDPVAQGRIRPGSALRLANETSRERKLNPHDQFGRLATHLGRLLQFETVTKIYSVSAPLRCLVG